MAMRPPNERGGPPAADRESRPEESGSYHATGSSESIPGRQFTGEQLDARLCHDATSRRAALGFIPVPRRPEDGRDVCPLGISHGPEVPHIYAEYRAPQRPDRAALLVTRPCPICRRKHTRGVGNDPNGSTGAPESRTARAATNQARTASSHSGVRRDRHRVRPHP